MRTKSWQYCRPVAYGLLGLVLASTAGAQENTATPTKTAPSAAAKAPAAATPTSDSGATQTPVKIDTKSAPSRFIPSEEISEDLSVSFPADI